MPTAKNLKYCRKKANLTQQAFADAIGVAKSTVNAWELKKRAIPMPSAKKISEHFGVNYQEFCDVDLEMMDKGLDKNPVTLTDEEILSVLMFRQLPTNVKQLLRHAMAVSYDNTFIKEGL